MIFWLDVLFIINNRVLKAIIVLLSIYLFSSVNVCITYGGTLMFWDWTSKI